MFMVQIKKAHYCVTKFNTPRLPSQSTGFRNFTLDKFVCKFVGVVGFGVQPESRRPHRAPARRCCLRLAASSGRRQTAPTDGAPGSSTCTSPKKRNEVFCISS